MIIWALTDRRPGNDNQTLALAEKIGPYVVKQVEFSFLAKLPNFLLGTSLLGVKTRFSEPYPDLIICAGRKLARVAAHMHKKFGSNILQIMYPGKTLEPYPNFIIVPQHDEIPDAPHIIQIPGAVCYDRPDIRGHFMGMMDRAAVLIGNISEQEAEEMAGILNLSKVHYMITTSRRTKPQIAGILDEMLTGSREIHRYGNGQNPYMEYLRTADVIIATGDSVGMCSEAAHTGKPVYIFENETKKKFQKFWEYLYRLGCARPLTDKLEGWKYTPLNNIGTVMKQMNARA